MILQPIRNFQKDKSKLLRGSGLFHLWKKWSMSRNRGMRPYFPPPDSKRSIQIDSSNRFAFGIAPEITSSKNMTKYKNKIFCRRNIKHVNKNFSTLQWWNMEPVIGKRFAGNYPTFLNKYLALMLTAFKISIKKAIYMKFMKINLNIKFRTHSYSVHVKNVHVNNIWKIKFCLLI